MISIVLAAIALTQSPSPPVPSSDLDLETRRLGDEEIVLVSGEADVAARRHPVLRSALRLHKLTHRHDAKTVELIDQALADERVIDEFRDHLHDAGAPLDSLKDLIAWLAANVGTWLPILIEIILALIKK